MADIVCAKCGEDERLLGDRSSDNPDIITITCEVCGLCWDRDLTPSCPTCGTTNVYPAFQAVLDKSRGTQLSIQSMRLVHLCPNCDPERHAIYSQTNSPIPPDVLPIETND
ncbi:MAG: hypothetical protein V3V01_16805 [Acidimicrobiales bacterium]